ncbi:MAG: cation-translocating P-type ATPase [Actinomycetota bacterium]
MDEKHEEHFEGPWFRYLPFRVGLVSGLVLGLGFLVRHAGGPSWAFIGLYVAAGTLGASHWGAEVLESLEHRRVNIDVLMAVATIGSAILGMWEEAAFLSFLYGAAEGVEEFTYDRTRGAIRALLDLAPKEAHLLRGGVETTVPAAELVPGDRFLVRPGESLPTDGVIRAGATTLNESAVTGESVPVERSVGEEVLACTNNLTGAIEVEATRAFEENTLSRIIHLVEEAQERKTSAQRFIDRFGAVYSPAVLLGSLLLIVIPALLGGDIREWARRAVTLAVAGAPCALVMSTPVAVAAAIGSAGKRGVLIKGGLHLENLGRVKALAFDKTGTLTIGRPQVTDVLALGTGADRARVLALAGAVERYSEHPLARAIVRCADRERVERMVAAEFKALTGIGAKARVGGTEIYVGSLALLGSLGAEGSEAQALADGYQEQGKTVVAVGDRERIVGLVAMRDDPRPAARDAIRSLREAGISHLALLTGDNPHTAAAIAREVGIEEVEAGLRPEAKATAIAEIEKWHGPTAMVGDGINDAPALAAATVGIAMGTGGTDAAIEAADVALMGDDLAGVAYAVRLGRRARHISRQNIAFSIAVLAVLVPSAVLGFLSVAAVVTAHELAEILAVLNGLRARTS